MSKDYENIEEKLVPYLEGVLNPKERRDIDEAINSDGELAREMSELRDVILELRQGFANGMKPPQEELTVDEVVEMSANTGSVDSMPGTSQQKAKLFCSDTALEEYSLLRALQEEMARTTLDRENVPDIPPALFKEFRSLKATSASRKVVPFKKPSLSPVPLWRRASSMLDRIDPKPLMASAAALVMLSLGVHFYQQPRSGAATSEAPAIGYNFSDEKKLAAISPTPSASSSPNGTKDGSVAVFTSDDRGLLKEQAEKLMANKVRYTVTKDRILVAEKDVQEARGILWADTDDKVVAMASKEKGPTKRLTQPEGGSAAAGGASSAPVSEEAPPVAYASGTTNSRSQPAEAPVIVADEAIEAAATGNVYYSGPSRQDAPAKPASRAPRAATQTYQRPPAPSKDSKSARDPGAELEDGLRGGSLKGGVAASYDDKPQPSNVDLGATSSVATENSAETLPEPAVVDLNVKPSEPAPVSAERRQKLKDLALGEGGESAARVPSPKKAEVPAPARPKAPITQVQSTTAVTRARVAAVPAPTAASAPVANVITAPGASADSPGDDEVETVDKRVAKMELSRQQVAQRNSVELSFESKDGKVSVYARPKKTLTKAELDALRKTLRKELGLADSDTIIFR